MRNWGSKSLLPLVAVGLMIGCGGNPPTAELEAANRALQDARSAGADKVPTRKRKVPWRPSSRS